MNEYDPEYQAWVEAQYKRNQMTPDDVAEAIKNGDYMPDESKAAA